MRASQHAPNLARGALGGLLILAGQAALAIALGGRTEGLRAQALGFGLGSALALALGWALGALEERRALSALAASDAGRAALAGRSAGPGSEALRLLQETLAPLRAVPWAAALGAALALSAAALLLDATGLGLSLLGGGGPGAPGLVGAMLALDVATVPTAALIALGAALGVHARRRALPVALLGLVALATLSALALQIARALAFDPQVVAALALVGVAKAALVSGFAVAAARRALAFVELLTIALLGGFAIYLGVALGPEDWLLGTNVPAEQIFAALAAFPAVVLASLLTVGGSLGFFLFGSGRFDPGFRFEVRIALRYLKAQRRDGFVGAVTVIAVLGVCLGVMALIIMLSIMSGFEGDLKAKILGAHAHVVVTKLGDDFTEYAEVEGRLVDVPGVVSAQTFALGDAMISSDAGLSGTLVKGIDPRSSGARDLRKIVERGDLDDLLRPERIPGARPRLSLPPLGTHSRTSSAAGTSTLTGLAPPIPGQELAVREPRESGRKVLPGIVIGRELAKTLRAYVGDTVKLVSPASEEIGPLGPTPKLRRFRVAGIFFSGMYEYDAKFTYLAIDEAQRFFGTPGEATGVELKLASIDETARMVERVRARLGGHPYQVKDWRSMNKELFSALLLEKIAMFVALGMIVVVASFLIVAVLVMIVLQRKKEVAILKSLGASDASIMKVFVIQGLCLGVGGALLGGLLGVLTCFVLERYVHLDEKVFYIERLPVVMDWTEISLIAVAAVVMTYLATIYPAITAAQHRPVEGLRDD
jgi:lipoprotein-releasing system permease protein